MNYRRYNTLPLKTLAAKHGTSLRRLEWHGCFRAAIRACGTCFRTHRRPPGGALCLAELASLRVVSELFIVEEKLLTGGKDEIVSAIDALENLIDELHTRVPQPRCRATAATAQSPIHAHSE